jgi:hypothetical protein
VFRVDCRLPPVNYSIHKLASPGLIGPLFLDRSPSRNGRTRRPSLIHKDAAGGWPSFVQISSFPSVNYRPVKISSL